MSSQCIEIPESVVCVTVSDEVPAESLRVKFNPPRRDRGPGRVQVELNPEMARVIWAELGRSLGIIDGDAGV